MSLVALLAPALTVDSAAAGPRVLTVTAARSAYVDVRIPRPVAFDLDQATFRGGSTYMAFVLERVGDGRDVELLHARFPRIATQAGSDRTLGFDQESGMLPAGTYRLYALSDGAVRFTIRATGLARDVHLRPGRYVTPRYRSIDVPQALDPSIGTPYGGMRRIAGIDVNPRTLTIARFGAAFAPGTVAADGWDFCAAMPPDECAQPAGLDGSKAVVGSTGSRVDIVMYLPPDLYTHGTYDIVAKCRALEEAEACRAAVLDGYTSSDAPASRPVAL